MSLKVKIGANGTDFNGARNKSWQKIYLTLLTTVTESLPLVNNSLWF